MVGVWGSGDQEGGWWSPGVVGVKGVVGVEGESVVVSRLVGVKGWWGSTSSRVQGGGGVKMVVGVRGWWGLHLHR